MKVDWQKDGVEEQPQHEMRGDLRLECKNHPVHYVGRPFFLTAECCFCESSSEVTAMAVALVVDANMALCTVH